MELGGKFWLAFVGGAIACAIGGVILFLVLEEAALRWGFLGMFLFLTAALLAFGWIFDRREKRKRQELAEEMRLAP